MTAGVRDQLEVLASEKDVEGYQRVADLVDGNAYYWSSVNPDRHPGYGRKLAAMAAAVHAHHGLWVAPFAPGFDARLVGGTSVVDRQDGRTLRREYATALSSSPDALALISWNEFSENTHVEPSQRHGTRYLDVLRDLTAAAPPPLGALAVDSSEPAGGGSPTGFLLLCVVLAFLLITGTGLVLRRRAAPESGPGSDPSHHRHRARRRRALRMFLGLGAIAMLLAGVLRTSEDPSSGVAPPAETSGAPPPPRYIGAVAARTNGQAVVAAAGDIACPADAAGLAPAERDRPDSCQAKATSELVIALKPDAVLALGDNQYPNGSLRRFRAAYDKTWGRFKSITHPVPGNHEYGLPGARGYFSYFGEAAGHPDEGWYSFDVVGWHLVALNSECDHVGGCGRGRPRRASFPLHPGILAPTQVLVRDARR